MLRDSGQQVEHVENDAEGGVESHETSSAANNDGQKDVVSLSSNDNENPESAVQVLFGDKDMPVPVSSLTDITPKREGVFARLYNSASRTFTRESALNMGTSLYNGLKHSFTTKAGLKDLGIGITLGSGLKLTAIGLGAAGIMTVSAPIVFGLGVAGSVARTVWQINKERHAAAQASGFPAANLLSRDFFKAVGETVDWAKDNKKRAATLLGGTFLSTVGVGAVVGLGALWDHIMGHAPVAVPVAVPTHAPVSAGISAATPDTTPAAPLSHAPVAQHAPVPHAVPVDNKPSIAPVIKTPVAPVATPVDTITAPVETPVVAPAPTLNVDSSVFTLDDTVTAPTEAPDVSAPVVTDTAPVPADAPVFDTAPVPHTELAAPTMPEVTVAPEAIPADAPVSAPVSAVPVDAPTAVPPVSVTPELVSPPIAQSAPPVGQAFNMNLAGNAANNETFTATLRTAPGMLKVGDKFNIEIDQLTLVMR